MDVLLGIDLGTTGVKALFVDPSSGREVAAGYRVYPSSAGLDRHEQDPADWWAATVAAVREGLARGVAPEAVLAVGLSGHMHALALVDSDDRWVRPAMTWADRRCTAQVKRLRGCSELFAERCANPVVEAFTAPKLAWVAEHEPGALARAAQLVQPKDALRHHLTGSWGTDVSDARGTLLFDVQDDKWDQELWRLCGAEAALAPPVSESTEIVGTVTRAAAAETGLREGTPVVAGAADVACSALGAGVDRPGTVYVNAGTAAQVLAPLPEPVAGSHFVFGQAASRAYLAMASVYAAGLSVDWAATLLGAGEATGSHVDRLAASAPPGSAGAVFLPHLLGLSVPSHDPSVRGGLVGLSAEHTPAAIARAVLEGVAFDCADAVDHVAGVAGAVREVRIGGGLARSEVWTRTIAALIDVPVRRLTAAASPVGAVILAGLGVGLWADAAAAIEACVAVDDVPGGEERAATRRARHRFHAALLSLTDLAHDDDFSERETTGP